MTYQEMMDAYDKIKGIENKITSDEEIVAFIKTIVFNAVQFSSKLSRKNPNYIQTRELFDLFTEVELNIKDESEMPVNPYKS